VKGCRDETSKPQMVIIDIENNIYSGILIRQNGKMGRFYLAAEGGKL
jgi:hypothetical protein